MITASCINSKFCEEEHVTRWHLGTVQQSNSVLGMGETKNMLKISEDCILQLQSSSRRHLVWILRFGEIRQKTKLYQVASWTLSPTIDSILDKFWLWWKKRTCIKESPLATASPSAVFFLNIHLCPASWTNQISRRQPLQENSGSVIMDVKQSQSSSTAIPTRRKCGESRTLNYTRVAHWISWPSFVWS